MDITEVRIKLMDADSGGNDRLRAVASIIIDSCFRITDVKVISTSGGLFCAMPSRKITDACPACGSKNALRSRFCGQCGVRLGDSREFVDDSGRLKLFADLAHPITQAARASVESAVLGAYYDEVERAMRPGYVCRYSAFDDGEAGPGEWEEPAGSVASIPSAPLGGFRRARTAIGGAR